MPSLSDLTLSTYSFAAGTVVGTVLATIGGVSPAIGAAFVPSEDFSDARNSQNL